MPRLVPIPAHLRGAAFRVGDEAFHGLGAKRLRSADIARPFTGVRSVGIDIESVLGLSRAYEPLLRPGEAFSHATAAMLHGLPLPPTVPTRPLHVLSPTAVSRARTRGVLGHEASASFTVVVRHGLPVVEPVLAWSQLGAVLHAADLVAVGDAIVTGRRGGAVRPPLATIEELEAGVRDWGRRRGARALAAALPRTAGSRVAARDAPAASPRRRRAARADDPGSDRGRGGYRDAAPRPRLPRMADRLRVRGGAASRARPLEAGHHAPREVRGRGVACHPSDL